MKKISIALITLVSFVTLSFANIKDEKSAVNFKVLNEFANTFADAENVQWKVTKDFVKATFEQDEVVYEAFYNQQGEFIGKSQKIEFKKLPKKAQAQLKLNYPLKNNTINDCIVYTNAEGETNYFVSTTNNNIKTILKITNNSEISVFQK